jgi:glutamate formiminotransferase
MSPASPVSPVSPLSIVECVPNFSEGRRPEVLDEIVGAIASAPGVSVIDRSMDASHNRAVVTFVGPLERVGEAAFRGIAKARERIDLRHHSGEHPRIGATDVVPFVPVAGATMEACVAVARALGARVGRELGIPVYFYEEAATRPSRRNLPDVRNVGFEKLRELMGSDPERAPDAGPERVHESAGATVIGARFFLIAFNVNLATEDVKLAKEIAKKIREKDGGLPGIKAMGFFLEDQRRAQVSMNVCNYTRTGLLQVYREIERLAAERGVAVHASELVGLAPAAALPAGVAERVKLAGFDPEQQLIENRIARAAAAGPAR